MIWRRSQPSSSVLDQLYADLQTMGIDSVRVQALKNELLLEGWVPSYEIKRLVVSRVAGLRWPVRNCLRIAPGDEVPATE